MLCKSCFNKIKEQDFYCRNCGLRTPKMPLEGEKLWTPVNILENKEEDSKNPYKKFYIYAFIILGMFLIVIIYLIILILKNKV